LGNVFDSYFYDQDTSRAVIGAVEDDKMQAKVSVVSDTEFNQQFANRHDREAK